MKDYIDFLRLVTGVNNKVIVALHIVYGLVLLIGGIIMIIGVCDLFITLEGL